MTTFFADAAFSLPLAWARLYTLGLPQPDREARLMKVASDLYEQRRAAELASNGRPAPFAVLEVLVCLAGSIQADLIWRFQRGQARRIARLSAGESVVPAPALTALAVATLAALAKLSAVHDLDGLDHLLTTMALIVGPLLTVVSLFLARSAPVTAVGGVTAGFGLLATTTWSTMVGPIAAVIGAAFAFLFVLESWTARKTKHVSRAVSQLSVGSALLLDDEEEGFAVTSSLERWLSLGALVWAIGFVLMVVSPGGQDPGTTDQEILEFYADFDETTAYLGVLGSTLGGLGLLAFAGGLYAGLRRAEHGTGFVSALGLVGAAIFVMMFLLNAALANLVAISLSSQDEFGAVDPQDVRLFGNLGILVLNVAGMGAALPVGAAAVVALRSGEVLNRWFAWSGAALALLLLATFPLFGMPIALFTVWVLALGAWRLIKGIGTASGAVAMQPA